MKDFDIGDEVELSCEVRDHSGVLTNPTTIDLIIGFPDGTSATRSLGSGVVATGVGLFKSDLMLLAAGVHKYRWQTTGNVVAVEPGAFNVKRDAFVP